MPDIKYEAFQNFIDNLSYNYLYEAAVINYQHSSIFACDDLKTEILDNIILLNKDEKQAYLNRIKFEISLNIKNINVTDEEIEALCKKYETPLEDIYKLVPKSNLFHFLASTKLSSQSDYEGWMIQNSFYNWEYKNNIENMLDFIDKLDSDNAYKSDIYWQINDTDLLELITALIESGAINNSTKNLTRKEAIAFFEFAFNRNIKDAESKLSRATNRKKSESPFLEKLKQSFTDYCIEKNK